MVHPLYIPYAEDPHGQVVPGLVEPMHRVGAEVTSCRDEVAGTGAAGGDLIASIQVPPGRTLLVNEVVAATKTGAATVVLVQSDNAVPGAGVEVFIRALDMAFPPGQASAAGGQVRNTTAGNLWALLYAPANRAGAPGNNAAGQFFAGSISGYLV